MGPASYAWPRRTHVWYAWPFPFPSTQKAGFGIQSRRQCGRWIGKSHHETKLPGFVCCSSVPQSVLPLLLTTFPRHGTRQSLVSCQDWGGGGPLCSLPHRLLPCAPLTTHIHPLTRRHNPLLTLHPEDFRHTESTTLNDGFLEICFVIREWVFIYTVLSNLGHVSETQGCLMWISLYDSSWP